MRERPGLALLLLLLLTTGALRAQETANAPPTFIDLDDGSLQGGTMWRLTPMVNWHMSDNVRLEFVYGYSLLDRFDLEGRTQFFQARVQFTL